jgi:hypothetical protein
VAAQSALCWRESKAAVRIEGHTAMPTANECRLRRPRVKLLPPKTATGTARTVGAAGEIATFTINMKYKGREHSTALPLSPKMISRLALEASFRDQKSANS